MNELEASSDTHSESPFAVGRVPQPSILHLMLWTLCSALYLTSIRALQSDLRIEHTTTQDSYNLLQAILAGAVFAGTTLLLSTRVRIGPPMLRYPGHWLLIISASIHLIHLLILLVSGLRMSHLVRMGTRLVAIHGLACVLAAIAYVLAARFNHSRSWKILFAALAVLALTHCILFGVLGLSSPRGFLLGILPTVGTWGSPAIAGAMVVVSMVELGAGQRRDWLHWTGVMTHVAASGVTLMWIVRSWFMG